MYFLELGKQQKDHDSAVLIEQDKAGQSVSGESTIERIAKELTAEESFY